ncbi:biopolymer transporter Tol [Granulicella sp. WH15]|uniref:biopolymer transporter Tol n=1 Tax=Granulicella sp. WH15 TaxID=2602070 RepID=UPI001367842D|nr:biopolymer transporter Tol [Granulicella sp. WH15]QHN03581.1 biopolymer transporter Tol [Granulicella sp. WH15]
MFAATLCAGTRLLPAQAAAVQTPGTPEVPDWALPGSPTHKQYAPPVDFHRATKTFDQPIGVFQGQSDIGGPLVPGSATYDAATKQYTINSAGYNIWYTRDEFRFLWKKMSGDISLAADGTFPIPSTPHDRKIVLILRQDLEDDSKEIMVGEHGTGMVHLAARSQKNAEIKDMQYRIGGSLLPAVMPQRIGIQKHGDEVAMFISVKGEPMHQFGPPLSIHFDGPFYVGVGFCSHYPVTVDTGVLANVTLENSAEKLH